jgi:hypothetical protein
VVVKNCHQWSFVIVFLGLTSLNMLGFILTVRWVKCVQFSQSLNFTPVSVLFLCCWGLKCLLMEVRTWTYSYSRKDTCVLLFPMFRRLVFTCGLLAPGLTGRLVSLSEAWRSAHQSIVSVARHSTGGRKIRFFLSQRRCDVLGEEKWKVFFLMQFLTENTVRQPPFSESSFFTWGTH